jgi:hypothetical protein
MKRITENQMKVLSAAASYGASKGNFHGKYWRNFDQLERRGLIARQQFTGFYRLTDAGKTLEIKNGND